jgi:hypothetical protein
VIAAVATAAPAGDPEVIVTSARPDPGPGGPAQPGGESASTIPGGTLHV